jgi:hypothetical protein
VECWEAAAGVGKGALYFLYALRALPLKAMECEFFDSTGSAIPPRRCAPGNTYLSGVPEQNV